MNHILLNKVMKKFAPLLIMTAAGLWALDNLLRAKLSTQIPATSIIFYEHLIGFVLLAPFFFKSLPRLKKLKKIDWLHVLILTIVSSVGATTLFTQSFRIAAAMYDFATPVLLLSLQQVFVVFLSWIFLKEKVSLRNLGLGVIAIIGSYMISFGTQKVQLTFAGKELVYLLATGAAFFWGVGTILSKKLLSKVSSNDATVLRFMMAVPVALISIFVVGYATGTNQWFAPQNLDISHIVRLLLIGLSTGAASILIYYKGLQYVNANVSTFAELVYPIISLLVAITALNPFGSPQQLSLANIFGIIILLIAITLISFDQDRK